MRVYYFTKAEHGLDNIRNQQVKISDFSNLNDPFELLGIEMREKDIREALKFEKSKISKSKGLVCFSESKYDPVQWAHYTENHSGVCLGFDVPEKELRKVKYVSERLAKSTMGNPDKMEKLLTTKFRHWEYEKEQRLIVNLRSHTKNEIGHFKSFGVDLVLKEVYIGCQSKITFDEVKSCFDPGGNAIIIKHTRPSFKDFRIVWNQKLRSVRA